VKKDFKPSSVLMLPTGQNYPPVSIGELPSYEYQVSVRAIAEDVTSHLEVHPEIPGVILLDGDQVHSMIPRYRIFERLGHRYGVELFLRKPIIELQENLKTTACIISNNTRVDTAINTALGRKPESIYDPLVMRYDDGHFSLLDMHILLMAQSLVMENLHNIISNMNRIEQSIKAEIPFDTALDMIVDAIKRTIPHHRTAILVKPHQKTKLFSHHKLLNYLPEPLSDLPLLKSIHDKRHYIHVEDTSIMPVWKEMEFIGKANVWVGLPISNKGSMDGILSLSRATNTPFIKNEIDMAMTFSEFLGIAMNRSVDNHEANQFVDMVKRKFIY